jgi:hypothetical protein
MTAPSVITPESANKLKKAKQLSGTASASNKSRFLAKCVCLWFAAQLNSNVRTTLSKKFNDRNRRPMSNDAKLKRCHEYLTNAEACASFGASTGAARRAPSIAI